MKFCIDVKLRLVFERKTIPVTTLLWSDSIYKMLMLMKMFYVSVLCDSSFLLIDNGALLNGHLGHLALWSGSGSAGSYCSSAVPSTALIFELDGHEFGSIVTDSGRCGTPSYNFSVFFVANF